MPAALLLAFRPAGLDGAHVAAFRAVAGAFPARVRAMRADELAEDRLLVATWSHDASVGDGIARDERGGWAAVLGNPSSAALTGVGPADVPRRLLDLGAGALDALSPPYALALRERRDAPIHVAVDPCGVQHLYLREEPDGTVWISSSLLALAATLGATLDEDAVAEWLAAGHFMSERTMVREVGKIGAGVRLRLDDAGCTALGAWRPTTPDPATDADYRDALLQAIRDRHHEAATAAELTGGLDSRLILAGRLAAGEPTLSWTTGDPRSAELRTVARLQRAAGFEHLAAAVDPHRPPGPAQLVREMHELSDGEVNALEYSPLLDAFDQLAGRWRVSLSGAGGETGRGYYYGALKDGRLDAGALTHKIAGATGAAVATLPADRFPEPLGPLRTAIDELLASSALDRDENRLEEVYLRGRMQRFAGRNTSTTGCFFRQALPFFDSRVVAACLGLAPGRKADGAVMRDAVRAWAPALAAIPLDSGMSVAPRSWRHPVTQGRWALAMGRKVAARYGGAPGRRLAGPGPVPWDAIRTDAGVRDLVGEMLLDDGCRVAGLLDRGAVRGLAARGLAGQDLYALGLVLTLEMTLRRIGKPS